MAEVETSKNHGMCVRGWAEGSYNNPTGCGASRAYAPGPDDEEEEEEVLTFTL